MSLHSLRALIGVGGAMVMLLPTPAEAQIVRRFHGGGVLVRAPLVRVNVGPYGGTSIRAPLVAIDPGSVRIGLRRRLAPLPQYVIPPQQAMQPGYGVLPAAGAIPFPTADELAAMDDSRLFAALRGLSAQLERRLARLKTGAGWQRHLLISDSALSDSMVNVELLQKALARFDSVADNPEYAKIAGLPSFIATKAALRQVVTRFDGPRIVEPSGADSTAPAEKPSAEEVLPTPAPAAEPEAKHGQHSILKRAVRD